MVKVLKIMTRGIQIRVFERTKLPPDRNFKDGEYSKAVKVMTGLFYDNTRRESIGIIYNPGASNYAFSNGHVENDMGLTFTTHMIHETSNNLNEMNMYRLLNLANVVNIEVPKGTLKREISWVLNALFTKSTDAAGKWIREQRFGSIIELKNH